MRLLCAAWPGVFCFPILPFLLPLRAAASVKARDTQSKELELSLSSPAAGPTRVSWHTTAFAYSRMAAPVCFPSLGDATEAHRHAPGKANPRRKRLRDKNPKKRKERQKEGGCSVAIHQASASSPSSAAASEAEEPTPVCSGSSSMPSLAARRWPCWRLPRCHLACASGVDGTLQKLDHHHTTRRRVRREPSRRVQPQNRRHAWPTRRRPGARAALRWMGVLSSAARSVERPPD
jgi:hypothetical protein